MTTCHGFQRASKEFDTGLEAFIVFHFASFHFYWEKREEKNVF